MKTGLSSIPDLASLELEDYGKRLTQRFRLFLMALLVLCAMIAMALEGGPRRPILFWTASAVVLFVLAIRQHAPILLRTTPLDQWPNRRIGLFMPDRVEAIYAEVVAAWKDEKYPPPVLHIGQDRNKPAFTVRNCLTSDPRFHAIYLSEDLFYWLKSDELKGVLAHELSHYYRYSGAMMRCYPLVLAIMAFFPLTLLELLPWSNLYLLAVLWPVVYHLVRLLLLGLQRRDAYWQEYLADAKAVRSSSVLDVINGLLLVHKRLDNLIMAYRHVLKRVKRSKTVPLSMVDGLIDEIWTQLPRRVMRGETVRKVVDDLFENRVNSVSRAAEIDRLSLLKRNRQLGRMLRQSRPLAMRRSLQWETFRSVQGNWRLDETAYRDLVGDLLGQPNKQLTFFAGMQERGRAVSHPKLRNRILFIYKNFSAPERQMGWTGSVT